MRSRLRPRALVAALAPMLLVTLGCSDLHPLPEDACGNAVKDDGEDCDSHADPSFPAGTACGAEGTPRQCRYECEPATGATCPTGWGCGRDGICRNPTGEFDLAHDTISGVVRVLLPADFDGNKRPTLMTMSDDDSLGRRIATIIDLAGAAGVQVPAQVFSPSVADFDGDRHSDVAFADLRGVAVFHGNAQHTADFVSYPATLLKSQSTVRAIPIDVLPDQKGDELVGFVATSKTTAAFEILPDRQTQEATLLALSFPAENMSGAIVWGKLVELPSAHCDSIVFAQTGKTSVSLFSPCRPSGMAGFEWNIQTGDQNVPDPKFVPPTSVALPATAQVDAGVMLARVDADAHLDLLIGASKKTYVAYGNGDGTFGTAPPDALNVPQGKQGAAVEFTGLPEGVELPLALADLDGDGLSDVVAPGGIYFFHPGMKTYAQVYTNVAAEWTEAAVADFNRDGLVDVIGGSDTELNLQFLNNAGDGGFNETAVPTNGPPSHLTMGDFDGDLVRDIAFSTHGVDGDAWTVAFGNTAGAPTALRPMGKLDEIVAMAAARLPDGSGADEISDLVMVSRAKATALESYVFALGRGERVMLAPFALRTAELDDQPIAVAAGHFFAGDAHPTVAAVGLGADKQLRLWHVNPATGDVIAGIPLPSFVPAQPGAFRYGVHMDAGDIDGTGVDKLVITGAFGDTSHSAIVVARPMGSGSTARFVVDSAPPAPFAYSSTLYSPVLLADLDGDPDGHLEAIYKPNDDSPGPLFVFWNDKGMGAFDPKSLLEIQPKLSPGEGVLDFACVRVKELCTLYVLSNAALYSVAIDAVAHTATLTQVLQPPDATGARVPLPGGRALASGDFNGDGLDDLAIGDETGTRILEAHPVLK